MRFNSIPDPQFLEENSTAPVYKTGSYEAKALEFVTPIEKFKDITTITHDMTGDGWIASSNIPDKNGDIKIYYVIDSGPYLLALESELAMRNCNKDILPEDGITPEDRKLLFNESCIEIIEYLLPFINEPNSRITNIYLDRLFPGLKYNLNELYLDREYDFFERSKIKTFFLTTEKTLELEKLAFEIERFSATTTAYSYGTLIPSHYPYYAIYGGMELPQMRINSSGISIITIKQTNPLQSQATFGQSIHLNQKVQSDVRMEQIKGNLIHELLHQFMIDDLWPQPFDEVATEYLAIRINTKNNPDSLANVGYPSELSLLNILIMQMSQVLNLSAEDICKELDYIFINGTPDAQAKFKELLTKSFGIDLAKRIIAYNFNNANEAIAAILNNDR